jgi:PAS domain S-box-containing protein
MSVELEYPTGDFSSIGENPATAYKLHSLTQPNCTFYCRKRVLARAACTAMALALFSLGTFVAMSPVSVQAQAELARPTEPVDAPALITNLHQLRQLTRHQARQKPPVNLRAVVTSFDSQWGALFVGDAEGACYISATNQGLRFTAGQVLAIEGHAEPGLTPQVAFRRLTVLSNAPLPMARVVSLDDLISTRNDCYRVAVHTVIRSMYKEFERLILHFGETGGRFEAHFPNYTDGSLPTMLLDARVEITGVVGANFNPQGQLIGIRLYPNSLADVRVLEPGPGESFKLPAITVKTVSLASPASAGRVKVIGTVTLSAPSGRLYVEDDSGGILARLFPRQPRLDITNGVYLPAPDPKDFRPGDQVEVAGYPALGEYAPLLADALVRKTGRGPVPAATQITSAEALTGNHDARLVSLRARLIAQAPRRVSGSDYHVLTMQEGSTLFEAAVPALEKVRSFKVGSLLRLAGVCDVQADESRVPRAFRLWVPAIGDVKLLEAPPLFGLGHAVAGATLVALLALARSWQLRRKVERQQREAAEHERVERGIRELNAGLERRVADRTAELARVAAIANASEARTRSIVESALDAVISMDASGRITGWNARAEAIFGWPAGEVLGRQLADTIIPPAQREAHSRGLKRFLATGEGPVLNRRIEVSALRRDGSEFPAELSIAPLQIEGSPHFSAFLRDITDRKLAEARLRASEERFSKAFHGSNARLAILDAADFRYIDVNDEFVRAYGYSREEIIGRTSLELGLWEDPAQREEAYKIYEREGRLRDFESRVCTRSGEVQVVLQSGDFIDVGDRRCILSVGIDITDRKRVEAELLHNYAREKELNELKSRFVAMVSHEFRTPLAIITSSAEILEAYLERLPEEERQENLRDITDATRHMSRMMEEVLVLGRVEAGKMTCRPAPLDLPMFCERIVDEVGSATSNRCSFHFTIAPGVGEVLADEGLLRHIFTNLLNNAAKYSPAGSLVEFQVQSRDHLAIFIVRDKGIGIPEADARMLFQAFHRGRNVGDTPGTGLGMTIVKRCVGHHFRRRPALVWNHSSGQWREHHAIYSRCDQRQKSHPYFIK